SRSRYKLRLNCWYFSISTCISRRPGSLRVDAFRGHGPSLLALAKGMSTLFAKNGFSRPSLEESCGVFGHVLFPQDQECYDSFCIARRKLVCIFEESTPSTHPDYEVVVYFLYSYYCS